MKKIITDTNVWYEIGKDRNLFPVNDLIELPLPVLYELYTSRNIIKSEEKFSEIQSAVNAILHFKNDIHFNHLNPIDNLINIHYPNYKPSNSVKKYLDEFEALSKLTYDECKNVKNSDERKVVSTTTDYYNKISKNYKLEIKNIGKNNFQKWDSLPKTKQLLIVIMNSNIEINHLELPQIKKYNFENIEFFIKVFDRHLRDIAISQEKLKDNDWNDLFLMSYVSPESIFWTFEDKWIRKINDLGLDSSLVNNNG